MNYNSWDRNIRPPRGPRGGNRGHRGGWRGRNRGWINNGYSMPPPNYQPGFQQRFPNSDSYNSYSNSPTNYHHSPSSYGSSNLSYHQRSHRSTPPEIKSTPVSTGTPLPGTEEYTQTKIQQTSNFIKRQLNIDTSNDNNIGTDILPNLNNELLLQNNEIKKVAEEEKLENEPVSVSNSNNSKKPKSIMKPRLSRSINVQDICDKIIHHITNLNYSKKMHLVHQGSTGYDFAVQQVQKQKRLELSRALRNMSNKPTQDSNDSALINSIIPDFGIKIEDLPREIIAELSSTLNCDVEGIPTSPSMDPEVFFKQAQEICDIFDTSNDLEDIGSLQDEKSSSNSSSLLSNRNDSSSFSLSNSNSTYSPGNFPGGKSPISSSSGSFQNLINYASPGSYSGHSQFQQLQQLQQQQQQAAAPAPPLPLTPTELAFLKQPPPPPPPLPPPPSVETIKEEKGGNYSPISVRKDLTDLNPEISDFDTKENLLQTVLKEQHNNKVQSLNLNLTDTQTQQEQQQHNNKVYNVNLNLPTTQQEQQHNNNFHNLNSPENVSKNEEFIINESLLDSSMLNVNDSMVDSSVNLLQVAAIDDPNSSLNTSQEKEVYDDALKDLMANTSLSLITEIGNTTFEECLEFNTTQNSQKDNSISQEQQQNESEEKNEPEICTLNSNLNLKEQEKSIQNEIQNVNENLTKTTTQLNRSKNNAKEKGDLNLNQQSKNKNAETSTKNLMNKENVEKAKTTTKNLINKDNNEKGENLNLNAKKNENIEKTATTTANLNLNANKESLECAETTTANLNLNLNANKENVVEQAKTTDKTENLNLNANINVENAETARENLNLHVNIENDVKNVKNSEELSENLVNIVDKGKKQDKANKEIDNNKQTAVATTTTSTSHFSSSTSSSKHKDNHNKNDGNVNIKHRSSSSSKDKDKENRDKMQSSKSRERSSDGKLKQGHKDKSHSHSHEDHHKSSSSSSHHHQSSSSNTNKSSQKPKNDQKSKTDTEKDKDKSKSDEKDKSKSDEKDKSKSDEKDKSKSDEKDKDKSKTDTEKDKDKSKTDIEKDKDKSKTDTEKDKDKSKIDTDKDKDKKNSNSKGKESRSSKGSSSNNKEKESHRKSDSHSHSHATKKSSCLKSSEMQTDSFKKVNKLMQTVEVKTKAACVQTLEKTFKNVGIQTENLIKQAVKKGGRGGVCNSIIARFEEIDRLIQDLQKQKQLLLDEIMSSLPQNVPSPADEIDAVAVTIEKSQESVFQAEATTTELKEGRQVDCKRRKITHTHAHELNQSKSNLEQQKQQQENKVEAKFENVDNENENDQLVSSSSISIKIPLNYSNHQPLSPVVLKSPNKSKKVKKKSRKRKNSRRDESLHEQQQQQQQEEDKIKHKSLITRHLDEVIDDVIRQYTVESEGDDDEENRKINLSCQKKKIEKVENQEILHSPDLIDNDVAKNEYVTVKQEDDDDHQVKKEGKDEEKAIEPIKIKLRKKNTYEIAQINQHDISLPDISKLEHHNTNEERNTSIANLIGCSSSSNINININSNRKRTMSDSVATSSCSNNKKLRIGSLQVENRNRNENDDELDDEENGSEQSKSLVLKDLYVNVTRLDISPYCNRVEKEMPVDEEAEEQTDDNNSYAKVSDWLRDNSKEMSNNSIDEEPPSDNENVILNDVNENCEESAENSAVASNFDDNGILRYKDFQGVILVVKIVGDELFAASDEGSIHCYNWKTGELTSSLKVATRPVTAITVLSGSQKWVVFGSLDGNLCFFNTDTKEIVKTVKLSDGIHCVELAWNFLFCGSYRGSIIRYCLEKEVDQAQKVSEQNVLMLKATQEGARKILLVASRNTPVTVRDAMSCLLLRTISTPSTVYTLLLQDSTLYFGTSQHYILVYSFHEGQSVCTYKAAKGVVCMQIVGNLLFAACYNGNIYVFNVRNNESLGVISGPGGLLLSMLIIEDYIIVGSKNSHLICMKIPQHFLDEK